MMASQDQGFEKVLVRKKSVGRDRVFHNPVRSEDDSLSSECGLLKESDMTKTVSADYAEKFFKECRRCDWSDE